MHGGRELIASTNDRFHVSLNDLKTLASKDSFAFSSPILAMLFSQDGSRLYVLTQDQTIFALGTDGAKATSGLKTAMQ